MTWPLVLASASSGSCKHQAINFEGFVRRPALLRGLSISREGKGAQDRSCISTELLWARWAGLRGLSDCRISYVRRNKVDSVISEVRTSNSSSMAMYRLPSGPVTMPHGTCTYVHEDLTKLMYSLCHMVPQVDAPPA